MHSFILSSLNGISYAFILFMLASGLSLIFGIMGVLNLAHGSLYVLGAYIGLTVMSHFNNFILAVVLAGIGVVIVGLLLERVFLQRLYKRYNEQALLTLGMIYIIANIILWIWGPYAKVGQPPAFLSTSIHFGDFVFPIYRLFIIVVGIVLFAVLWWFQDKTRAGSIIRAGMDNKEMTTSLGINYALVSTLVFALGAFMGGIAGFLGAPILGVFPTMSTNILLISFVVVVVGGSGSIQGALVGSLIIGIVNMFGNTYFPDASMFTVYAIFIIMLLLRPNGLLGRKIGGEAYVSDVHFSTATKAVSKGKRYLKLSPMAIAYIICGLVVIVFPLFLSTFISSLITKIMIFSIFAVSLNLLWGYTGLWSYGHAAYFGVAGYTVGILVHSFGITNFWILAAAGIMAATFLAAVFAIPILRVSGTYFLLVTLAFGELLKSVALKWRSVTLGSNGLAGIPYPNLGISTLKINAFSFYYLVFIIFVVCLFLMYRLIHSPLGWSFQGVRENEKRMASSGYHTWVHKYIVFIIAGLFAGVAGVLFAFFGGIMTPDNLGVATSTPVLLMVILGGWTTFFGPVLGAAVVLLLQFFASLYIPDRWPLIYGAVFVLGVMFLKGGMGAQLVNLWRKVTNGFAEG